VQLSQGACLIVNNAAQAIYKARRMISTARGMCLESKVQPIQFMLTIDEADDFYRTDDEDHEIKMEQQLRELKEIGPLVQFEVTATLLAIYMHLVRIDDANMPSGDIFYVEASQEYVDAKMLIPPSDAQGNPQFITDEKSLNNNNLYADHKVRAMWREAADHAPPSGAYGSLLLDATTAAVRAGGRTVGIYDKAKEAMRVHPHCIAVIVSGAEIAWSTREPRSDRPQDKTNLGQPPNLYRGKAKVFSEILEVIDTYYPTRPVLVFGYSQLVRGISYRSRRRVPSHFILLYKDGMPLCRLVQAAGRAMGEQASALRANGFGSVKLLTQTGDFDAIRAYPEFLLKIKERMSSGMSLNDALQTKFGGEFNCFNGKTVGQKKLKLEEICQQTLSFDHATPGILIGATAEDRAMGTDGKGLTRAILEVMIDGFTHLVYEEDEAVTTQAVFEELEKGDYDEFFEDGDREELNVSRVRSALKQMERPNANRPAVVLRTGPKGKPKYYLNAEGVDRLPGRDGSHRPHHQPTAALSEAQVLELMNSILNKAGGENGLAVLKLSGVPRSGAWQEHAYKQLAKLVHPNKWHSHGDTHVNLATRAFQAVQTAWDMQSGGLSAFVPDETDHNAVAAQREAAFAQHMDTAGTEEDAPVYRSLNGAPSAGPPPVAAGASFGPPPLLSRSGSLSKREIHLQRAQQEACEAQDYEAAQKAVQHALAFITSLGLAAPR